MKHFRNKTHDKEKEYAIKLEDVADLLDVEINTVRDWVKSKKLPYSHSGSGLDMRFRMDDVMAFILN
jgi:excisionase family DNA binding protein